MRTPSVLLALLLLGVVGGCGAPAAQSPQSAGQISPLAKPAEQGDLVIAVLGYPREIEYRVNGIRIQTEKPIPWWADARLELQLEAGTYRVEGLYIVRGWTGDKSTGHVATDDPVAVRAGSTTYLLANLAKDWRGVPAANPAELRVVDAATFTREIEAQRHTRPQPETASAAAASSTDPGAAASIEPAPATGSASIVIRGDEVLPPGTNPDALPAPAAPPPAAAAAAAATPEPAAAADTNSAVGLPSAADPESQVLLEPGASAPRTLALRLESEPAGARVFVDDQEAGVTPISVRIEPQLDHVIRFERDGCSEHVRFLSAAGWEKGRSTRLTAKLECQ